MKAPASGRNETTLMNAQWQKDNSSLREASPVTDSIHDREAGRTAPMVMTVAIQHHRSPARFPQDRQGGHSKIRDSCTTSHLRGFTHVRSNIKDSFDTDRAR